MPIVHTPAEESIRMLKVFSLVVMIDSCLCYQIDFVSNPTILLLSLWTTLSQSVLLSMMVVWLPPWKVQNEFGSLALGYYFYLIPFMRYILLIGDATLHRFFFALSVLSFLFQDATKMKNSLRVLFWIWHYDHFLKIRMLLIIWAWIIFLYWS